MWLPERRRACALGERGGGAPLRVRVCFRSATDPGNAADPSTLDAPLAAPLTRCYADPPCCLGQPREATLAAWCAGAAGPVAGRWDKGGRLGSGRPQPPPSVVDPMPAGQPGAVELTVHVVLVHLTPSLRPPPNTN